MADQPLAWRTSIFWLLAIQLRGFRKPTSFCFMSSAKLSSHVSAEEGPTKHAKDVSNKTVHRRNYLRDSCVPWAKKNVSLTPIFSGGARVRGSTAGARPRLNFQCRISRSYRESDRLSCKHHRDPRHVALGGSARHEI